MDKLNEGDRIYYKGDMANQAGEGKITEIIIDDMFGSFVDIELEDGRKFKRISPSSFNEGPGQKFFLMEDWKAKKSDKLDALQSRLKEMGIRK